MYQHPVGELSRGAVLDVGLKCTHSCKFCYYSYLDKSDDQFRGMRRAAFRSVEDCKAILDGLKANGFLHFDYTGGEPSLHPDIIEITRYAHRDLGLKGRMITLGQFLMKRMPHVQGAHLLDDLLDAGIVNFLLSVHAVDEDLYHRATGEKWSRLQAAMRHLDEREFDYTSNTTVFEWNYQHLPAIAREIVQHRVYLHNFILMNAYYEWNQGGKVFGVQARYDAIRPYLTEAIKILEDHGVAANIRYAPMCGVRGLERHLVGVVGVRYDAHEWMNEAGHFGGTPAQCAKPLDVEPGNIDPIFQQQLADATLPNGVRVIATRGTMKAFPSGCDGCAARDVCDGVDPKYLAQHGAEEFVPYAGPRWSFPVHAQRAGYAPPFLIKTEPAEDMRGVVARALTAPRAASPRVSVVVPCFNYGRYLREAVESVLAQTYTDYEVIIVDDGSTDDSRAVAEALAGEHPARVRVLAQENSGQPAHSRNAGIAAAHGELILCLDADDKIAPTMLAQCVARLDADPKVAIAYTDRRDFDGAEGVVCAGEYDFPLLRLQNHLSYCALFRKTAWSAVGGYRTNVKGCEDWDLWVAMGAAGFHGRRIPEPLFWYRRHDTGVFQEALQNFTDIHAQIICNNHEVYPAALVQEARNLLTGPPARTRPVVVEKPAPLVSVIMPTRDRPAFLRRAVASVLAQTWRPLELIVVNDGGAAVEALLAELDPLGVVTCVRLPVSRERSAARNVGLAVARGTYVAYLDDDDWYEPTHIARLVEALEREGAAVGYADARQVTEVRCGDGYVPTAMEVPLARDFDHETLLFGNFIPICGLMHRRDCLDVVGRFDETLATHEDWELLLRLARHWSFVRVPGVSCSYSWRVDGSSTTSSRQDDFRATGLEVRRRFAADATQFPGSAAAYAELWAALGDPERSGPAFDVSIVIPVRNRVDLTAQCLRALADVTDDVRFEVIMVDDGSTDETPALCASLSGDVQVVRHETSQGFAAACNAGAARARGRFLCFLNNDTIPRRDWLRALVDECVAHPEVGLVGSRLLYPDGTVQHAGVAFSKRYELPYHVFRGMPGDDPSVVTRREVQVVTGACLLVRREIFEALGGFDCVYRNGFEDVDFCLRVGMAGHRVVYQPGSVVTHLESQTPGREAHTHANVEAFKARWAGRVIADEDMFFVPAGYATWSHEESGPQELHPIVARIEREQWMRVAAFQAQVLAHGVAASVEWLARPESFPSDPLLFDWIGSLCARVTLPGAAAMCRARAQALRATAADRLVQAQSALDRGDVGVAELHVRAARTAMPGHRGALLLAETIALQSSQAKLATGALAPASERGPDRLGPAAVAAP